MNFRNFIAIILGVLMCVQISHAQSNKFKGDFEVNAKLISDYRFRGVTRTSNDFAVQGGVDFYSDTRLYMGLWASNVDGFNGAFAETNLYFGYSGEARGFIYDIGATAYLFPGGDNVNHIETYGSLGIDFGLLTSSVGLAYMPNQGNLGDNDNIYLYNDTKFYVPDTPFSIDLHLGFEDGAIGGSKKVDWKIGTSVSFENFELGIAYVDTNKNNLGQRFDSGVLFSVAGYF
jgi:uncharacterized protein (TIGR02001 family)